ncbi:hypothetical protein [Brevibacillus centrosporus]|nr:hypothetical protein [Brevibacillus centrosporus]GED35034.1 hypothetical protein BCE02nite_61750 [Brevibacillus centrosporus]
MLLELLDEKALISHFTIISSANDKRSRSLSVDSVAEPFSKNGWLALRL